MFKLLDDLNLTMTNVKMMIGLFETTGEE